MHQIDPYHPADAASRFECRNCGTRTETRGTCPDCDGPMINLSVPRE